MGDDRPLRAFWRRRFTDLAKIVAALTLVHMFVETPLHELGHLLAATEYEVPARVEAGDIIVTTNSATLPPLMFSCPADFSRDAPSSFRSQSRTPTATESCRSRRRGSRTLPLIQRPSDSLSASPQCSSYLAAIMSMYVLRFMRAMVPEPDP